MILRAPSSKESAARACVNGNASSGCSSADSLPGMGHSVHNVRPNGAPQRGHASARLMKGREEAQPSHKTLPGMSHTTQRVGLIVSKMEVARTLYIWLKSCN